MSLIFHFLSFLSDAILGCFAYEFVQVKVATERAAGAWLDRKLRNTLLFIFIIFMDLDNTFHCQTAT